MASIIGARDDRPRRAGIKALCAAHGLEVAGLTSYVRPDENDAVSRLIDACRTLGCPRFRIFSARYDPAVGYFALRDRRAPSSRASPAGSRARGSRRCSKSISARSSRARRSPSSCCATDPATIGVILDPANLVIEGGMDLRMGLDMLGDGSTSCTSRTSAGSRRLREMALALRRARRRPVRLGRDDRRVARGRLRRLAVAREFVARPGQAYRLCRRGPRRRVPGAARHRSAAARRSRCCAASALRRPRLGPRSPARLPSLR